MSTTTLDITPLETVVFSQTKKAKQILKNARRGDEARVSVPDGEILTVSADKVHEM